MFLQVVILHFTSFGDGKCSSFHVPKTNWFSLGRISRKLLFDQQKLLLSFQMMLLLSKASPRAWLEGRNTCAMTSCRQWFPKRAACAQLKQITVKNQGETHLRLQFSKSIIRRDRDITLQEFRSKPWKVITVTRKNWPRGKEDICDWVVYDAFDTVWLKWGSKRFERVLRWNSTDKKKWHRITWRVGLKWKRNTDATIVNNMAIDVEYTCW